MGLWAFPLNEFCNLKLNFLCFFLLGLLIDNMVKLPVFANRSLPFKTHFFIHYITVLINGMGLLGQEVVIFFNQNFFPFLSPAPVPLTTSNHKPDQTTNAFTLTLPLGLVKTWGKWESQKFLKIWRKFKKNEWAYFTKLLLLNTFIFKRNWAKLFFLSIFVIFCYIKLIFFLPYSLLKTGLKRWPND